MNIFELIRKRRENPPGELNQGLIEVLIPAAEEALEKLSREFLNCKVPYYQFDAYGILCKVNGGANVRKYESAIEKFCNFCDLSYARYEWVHALCMVLQRNGYTVSVKRRDYEGYYWCVRVSGWDNAANQNRAFSSYHVKVEKTGSSVIPISGKITRK